VTRSTPAEALGMDLPLVVVIDDWDGVVPSHPGLAELEDIAHVMVLGKVTDDELVDSARDAVVIVPFRERRRLDAALLERLPSLRHIAQTGGGVAHVEVAAAERLGISYSLTPGASAPAVAELVLGMALDALRGIRAGGNSLSAGGWERPLGRELGDLTIGILGAGATGAAVAERFAALGSSVVVTSRRPDALGGRFPLLELSRLCEVADVLSVHVELAPSTASMVGTAQLQALGPEGGLINVARSGIVDTSALLSALDDGRLGWAGLDVFDVEPPVSDPLARHPRVVATPHLGWRTHGTLQRYVAGALANAADFLRRQAAASLAPLAVFPTDPDDRK